MIISICIYIRAYIYMDVYIKDCIDIWDFSLVGVGWVLESWL